MGTIYAETMTHAWAWPGSVASELIDELARFEGPPEQFLARLLEGQCRLAGACEGAMLRVRQGAAEVIGVYPGPANESARPSWLDGSLILSRDVLAARRVAVRPLPALDGADGQSTEGYLLIVPLRPLGGAQGLAVFPVEADDPASLSVRCEQLELTAGLLGLYEARLSVRARQVHSQRLQKAMLLLSAVHRPRRFDASAMVMCNEAASEFACERVSLGVLKGAYVELRAISHTERFSRKTKLAQAIESAMEECLDQDQEVLYPCDPGATCVNRSACALAKSHGTATVLSVPLRRDGRSAAVVTLERPSERPFDLAEIETLRLVCELCAPHLMTLYEQDRWIGARAAAGVRATAARLGYPEHTGRKVAAGVGVVAVLFLLLARGEYRVEAPLVTKATGQRVVPAPFDGYLNEVFVSPGDAVTAGRTVLATLDTAEVHLELAGARAERLRYLREADRAMRDDKTAEAQIAQAQAARCEAMIDVLEYRVSQARIVAPLSGSVITGDMKRHLGAPVQTGDVLFEIAALDSLYVEMAVPEERIADVGAGQRGELAAVSYPEQRIAFVVTSINPVAEVVNGKNVFKVRGQLDARPDWMRPGMEGLAKITAGRRRCLWLWTHDLADWLRMKLWL
ncbi:MAG: HlyD family efflux transporter periplasmic adaptor subunit [Phycisphaerae bacterium]|nr:HlyD family efflux transporter periplasmic adaptor subunit [Phycisphaerae bacterium]